VAGRASGRKTKNLLQNMTCGAPSACTQTVGFARLCAVLLPIIVQCVNNGGGRCGVRRVRPVGDDAWRECCRPDRSTRAGMENGR